MPGLSGNEFNVCHEAPFYYVFLLVYLLDLLF